MPDRRHTIFAAVLAAGRSTRFGSTKQVAELEGVPLVRRAITTATRVCDSRVVTVIGHEWATVLRSMDAHSGFVLVNEDYEDGLGTSIAAAARSCGQHVDALLLLLADQPLVTPEHLQTLIESWTGADNEIVATSFADTEGPPVLFPASAFGPLAALTGDTGARAFFRDARFKLKTVHFDAAATDIDIPADLDTIT